MPPSPPKAGSPSAMEAFHASFQGALNDEFEALVRDLRAAAGAVADAADSSGANVDPDAWLSKRALVGELVARWTFLIATYRAHVAAEDEVVLPAVAARVSNVAHAYELEHEAEDELFESITAALDDANRSAETLCATATSGEPSSEHVGARERLRAAVQRAARIAHATKTVLQQHLAKEAAHLVPLLNDNFTKEEQADLVERFIASVPLGWVGPVLERGPTRGERGPLRTLLASWLARNRGGGKTPEIASLTPSELAGGPKRVGSAKRARTKSSGESGPKSANENETETVKKESPIDHIFQFHAALRRELLTLEADVLALPPPEAPSLRIDALRGLEGRFVFFWGVYRAHSRSEDELVFPALEDKDELHNVSHSYTLDHEHEAELFVDLDACLRDLRVAAGIGDAEDAAKSRLLVPSSSFAKPNPSKATVNDVERRLQAACAAVRVCLETHVAREEAELWPLFEKHFSETEQRRLVGLIIGRTGAEVLQSMLSWQRKALTENEKAAMIGGLRDASKNTRFASWLDTWWSGEDEAEGRKIASDADGDGAAANPEVKRAAPEDDGEGAAKADAAMEGLKHVQEYLKDRQQSSQKTSASSAAKAAAAAAAAAAAVDKTGYTPSWDDMFRMNRQQLEASARTLSRDDSLAPERKAYLMQHLLAARWICAQQRNKKNKEDGTRSAAAERADESLTNPDAFGGKRARDFATNETATDGTARNPNPATGSVLALHPPKVSRNAGSVDRSGRATTRSTAEALALAGADAVASFRDGNRAENENENENENDAGEPLVLCQPVVSVTSVARELGCKHYSRGVRLVAACCGAAHVCRFCHDEAEDHTIDRFATKEMVCMRCGERQPSSATCRACGVAPAKYFCSVCNFWDDAEDAYHCPFCNVCRRGKGLGKDFFHCMQCNSCVSLTMGPHDCPRADGAASQGVSAMESDCPVCKDFLWNSDTPVKAMPCGHMMHTRCFEAYTKHYYTCPLCRKSLGDFSAYFRMLDAILAEEREANGSIRESGLKTTQRVACNDCGEETVAPFHFVYHACAACRSYNTRVLGGPETTSAEAAL